jgi:hypothetical protein
MRNPYFSQSHPFLMTKTQLSFLFCIVLTTSALAQSQMRKLPPVINHPSLNVIAPFISADGNALLFVSDGGQDGALIVSYTTRESEWSVPTELPKHLNNRLNFLKGYALSGDGRTVFVTSAKSPVIGGYDIMVSQLTGNTWSMPVNLMLPINSKTNEGCPSLTPDGSSIFFMRCDRMDQNKADGCKIFTSRKQSNGQWGEPVELPSFINSGNSQTPRILPDGQTLLFSSDKLTPNKGGMDLYASRLENGSWSAPVPLDFANTERDDQYVSVSAVGRYLLKEAKGLRNNYEATEMLFPAALRPRALTKIEGKISGDAGSQIASYISVNDLQTGKKVYAGRPTSDGTFFLYLPEGSQYEFSVDPEQGDVSYFAKVFDLTGEKIPQKEKLNVSLKRPESGDEIVLDLISFKPNSAELTQISQLELRRFARLVKASAGSLFEVQLTLRGFRQDSVRSSEDLTEMRIDSVLVPVMLEEPDSMATDSIDSEQVFEKLAKITYHNDRTLQQAEAINRFLNKEGIKPDQLRFVTDAIESLEPPVVTVKAVVK